MAARDLASTPPRAGGPSALRSSRMTPPALAARYRALFVLGRGGMGTVEAALEVGAEEAGRAAYQRVVALKRLLPESGRDRRRVEMFLREARLAAMLDHPNVVRAFDYGEIDGELFLALEYIEGQPLSRVLRALADARGTLDVALTAHVLAEVCEGLHAAHELRDAAGQPLALVHRDVSPQNVMVAYDGHVRLLDFGVAKIEAESVTKTGEVKGKTAYMSPEQAMGDAIDRRSDLFGVGAVLFECLTLRRMWGDGTDMDVIRKLALEKPPRLEDARIAAPAELIALYTRLVAREAKDRPGSASEVAATLRTLVPQGAEAATLSLRAVLEKHFGEEAVEQRRRLTASLEEVAPEQARELRERVSPANPEDFARSPASRLREAARETKAASVAHARPDDNATAEQPSARGVAATTGATGRWPWLVVAALATAGIVVWKAGAGPGASAGAGGSTQGAAAAPGASEQRAGPGASADPGASSAPDAGQRASPAPGASPAPDAGQRASPAPGASPAPDAGQRASPAPGASPAGPNVAPGTPSGSAAGRPLAHGAALPTAGTPDSARVLAQPSIRIAIPPPSVGPSASAARTAAPAASAKPPPDVDDHPF